MSEISACLARLRAETRASHVSIETVPILAKLLSPDLTHAEYGAALGALHAFHETIAPRIANALASIPCLHKLMDGRVTRDLVEDLEWLGVRPSRRRPAIPNIESEAAAIGALYVIEGSGLGGRVIARHLADHLGVSASEGASFYGGLSAEMARARWQALCGVLEMDMAASYQDAVVATARETFESLERWMRQVAVSRSHCSLAVAAVA